MSKIKIVTELSHGAPHVTTRGDLVLPPPAEIARKPNGQFEKGNRAASRRTTLKKRVTTLVTLSGDSCPEWLAPFADAAREHAVELATRFDDPLLAPMISLCASHYAVAHGMLAQGMAGDTASFKELERHSKAYKNLFQTISAAWAQSAPEREEARRQAEWQAHSAWMATVEAERVPKFDYPAAPKPDANERRDYFDNEDQ
jgi:hypothetical protein